MVKNDDNEFEKKELTDEEKAAISTLLIIYIREKEICWYEEKGLCERIFVCKKMVIIIVIVSSKEIQDDDEDDKKEKKEETTKEEELLEETMQNTLFNKYVGQITKDIK